jgi:hypothetical protein
VSAFEPQPPPEPRADMPDFMVVLRGYDRRQVEVWARELANQLEQERQRADEAEKAVYRRQMEGASPPSFTHLGSHVASIIEEAGKSAENMLADAAERAQEAIDAAEAEAGEIIKGAEHRAGEIEQEARQLAEEHRAEGARIEHESREAAEEMRAQAEQDARTVLEEARDATDLIWQDAERERLAVESETRRLESLRSRAYEQLGRMYGHLESVLDEVRRGIGVQGPEEVEEAPAALELEATRPERAAARWPEPAAATLPEAPAANGEPPEAKEPGGSATETTQPTLPEAAEGGEAADPEATQELQSAAQGAKGPKGPQGGGPDEGGAGPS